jgi:hypothetical protein
MSMSRPPAPRKHLMVPGQPRPTQRQSSITSVQRWVMSVLVTTTILHLAAGLVVAAYYAHPTSSQVGLLVISGLFGMMAFEAAVLIHRKPLLSWWLLPGLIPAVVGVLWLFG